MNAWNYPQGRYNTARTNARFCLCIGAGIVGGGMCTTASAEQLQTFLALGLQAEIDAKDVEVEDISLRSLSNLNENEDIENLWGLGATWDTELGSSLYGGAMGLLTLGQGDDSEGTYTSLDLGPWLRYRLPVKKIGLDLALGAGLTALLFDDLNAPFGDYTFTGIGYYLALGALVSYPIDRNLEIVGGLWFVRQSVGELSDEADIEAGGRNLANEIEIVFEDNIVTRVLFTAGITFDL